MAQRLLRWVGLVAAGVLLAAAGACGGGDNASAPGTPANSSTSAVSPTAPATVAAATPTVGATAPLAANLLPCPADGFAVSGAGQGVGGVIAIAVSFGANGAACSYSGPLKVMLLDSSAVPLLGMAENPATFTVSGSNVLVTWRNWCAAPGTFRAVASAGTKSVTVVIPGPPRCDAPKEKSALAAG